MAPHPAELHAATREAVPAKLGYHTPAEWEPHEATWLAWPTNLDTWPTQLKEVEEIYVQMIEALASGEKVNILVNGVEGRSHAEKRLQGAAVGLQNIFFHNIPNFDSWMRDTGPIFITRRDHNEPIAITDWIFNAWGNKYLPWPHDNDIPKQIAEKLGIPRYEPGIVLEGGSIDINGLGTCLTTEQCLLNPNRNPSLSKSEIEKYLLDYLGVKKIIWLKKGIAGDDTDGHVDDIARFVNPTSIVCAVEEDSSDENYAALQENHRRLTEATDQSGKRLEIIKLPVPGKIFDGDRRLPASYANFYIGNAAVLVPTYRHQNDEQALKILRELFPTRHIIGIQCEALLYGFGAIHCVTQQQPKI